MHEVLVSLKLKCTSNLFGAYSDVEDFTVISSNFWSFKLHFITSVFSFDFLFIVYPVLCMFFFYSLDSQWLWFIENVFAPYFRDYLPSWQSSTLQFFDSPVQTFPRFMEGISDIFLVCLTTLHHTIP